MTDHLAVLEEMFALAANERRMKEADACAAAIALMRGQSETESTAIYLRKFDVTMIGQAKHAGQDMVSVLAHLHPTEGWNVRFNVAMQAKEAK